jgi:hypothetical protein
MKLATKIAGLCLASMLMMGMALAGNASAALLWLVCLKGTNSALTKYTNSKCNEKPTSLSTEEGWQSEGVPKGASITVKLLAISILLRDLGAKSAVLCFNTGSRGEGVIEEGGKGKVRAAEYEGAKANCRGVEGCEKEGIEAVKGVNLPWNTEIFETEKKALTKLSNSGAGEPGWEVVCKVAGVKKTDVCTSVAGNPEQAELVSEVTGGELLVRSRFEQLAEGTCTLGGAKAARVLGLLAILLPGGALSIHT